MREPQGPQIPHMNVLGIALFPEISHRCIHLIYYLMGMLVSKEGYISKIAARVLK